MFESKQSDYWYKEDTKEFIVCAITSVSAVGPAFKGDLISYFPCIYSIDRETNRKKLLFPSDVASCTAAQLTAENEPGYVYSFVPETSANIDLSEITKPLISYNEKNGLYNITFLGKYSDSNDGFSIFTYNFQYVNEEMVPVYSTVLLPESKNRDLNFTFADGNINPLFYIKGNSTATEDSFFNLNLGLDSYTFTNERPPNYKFKPFHYGNDLKFNTITYPTISSLVTANSTLPIGYSGGFITQKRNSLAYRTDHCIRVDFTCKSYSLSGSSQLGFVPTKTLTGSPVSATRSIDQYTLSSGPAEGFCVFFYIPDNNINLDLNGVNSSLGYSPASSNRFEVDAFSNWSSNGINLSGYVGIGFDIGGNFCTTYEGKPGSYDNTTYTQTQCSIGVRGGYDNDYKVLDQSSQITSVPIHETVSDELSAVYKDFRVELSKNAKKIIVQGKLSSDTDYIELYRLDMSKLLGYSFTVPPLLKVGLSSTTSLSVFNFELKEFKIEGVTE